MQLNAKERLEFFGEVSSVIMMDALTGLSINVSNMGKTCPLRPGPAAHVPGVDLSCMVVTLFLSLSPSSLPLSAMHVPLERGIRVARVARKRRLSFLHQLEEILVEDAGCCTRLGYLG